jgi:hypothetical protein
MERIEAKGQSTIQAGDMSNAPPIAPSPMSRTGTILASQAEAGTCATCGTAAAANPNGGEMTSYVYAIGSVDARFTTPSVEKEVAQAMGRAATAGLTDRQALHTLLSQRQNRYLARQMCYVFSVESVDAYILLPRDPADLELIVDAIQTPPSTDVDLIIGMRGPVAPPEMCNGLMIPIVVFDQLYTFTRADLFAAIEAPEGAPPEQVQLLTGSAQELFDRIMRIADNLGATDEHRALNYLSVRYDQIYRLAAQQFLNNSGLTAVEAVPSRLSGTRKLVNIIFTYTHRVTTVSAMYRVRVDVTDEFPFLDAPLTPYFEMER